MRVANLNQACITFGQASVFEPVEVLVSTLKATRLLVTESPFKKSFFFIYFRDKKLLFYIFYTLLQI